MTTDTFDADARLGVPTKPTQPGTLRAILSEPLVHFLALGAMLFALNAVIAPGVPKEKLIEVTPEIRQTLSETFAAGNKRQPTAGELLRLVDDWVLNEITYREALAQGFDKGDDMIRDRIMQKMRLLIFSNVSVPDPTPAELQAWLDAHRDQYDVPERVSFFDLAMGSSQGETEATLKLINTGNEPESLRLRARGFDDRPINSLTEAFGEDYLTKLKALPPHQWQALQAADGWHIARLDAVVPRRAVTLEEVRDPMIADWKQEKARANAVNTVREMGKSYVVRDSSAP